MRHNSVRKHYLDLFKKFIEKYAGEKVEIGMRDYEWMPKAMKAFSNALKIDKEDARRLLLHSEKKDV